VSDFIQLILFVYIIKHKTFADVKTGFGEGSKGTKVE
jgi:hypothetical protein